eukprot:6199073-Pleurochrysis_carterae.AAC.3
MTSGLSYLLPMIVSDQAMRTLTSTNTLALVCCIVHQNASRKSATPWNNAVAQITPGVCMMSEGLCNSYLGCIWGVNNCRGSNVMQYITSAATPFQSSGLSGFENMRLSKTVPNSLPA